jgi:hypothetical protein
MKKYFFLIIFGLLVSSCILKVNDTKRDKFLKGKIEQPESKSLLILQFKTPFYDSKIGKTTAEIFHQELLRKNILKRATLDTQTEWVVKYKDDETSIKNALSIAKKRGFDLILLGWVDKIVYGKLTGTEIILKIRLIEIKSKKTIWYERDIKKTKAHDKSYPIESKLSEPAPSIEYSIRALAKNMVSSMFESKRIKDFFKLWEKKK